MSDAATAIRAKAQRLPAKWCVHHDNRLRDTRGSYAAIAALSDEWGVASRILVARLHRLRVGAAHSKPRVIEKKAATLGVVAAAIKGSVSPATLAVIRAMEARGEATNAELQRDTGFTAPYLSSLRSKASAPLRRAGWQIARRGGGRGRPCVFWLDRTE